MRLFKITIHRNPMNRVEAVLAEKLKVMTLFESKRRTHDKPKRRTETPYDFIDKSNLIEMEKLRETLNSWFFYYPNIEKAELKARFESKDNISFESAFFELFLHELFRKQGFNLEPHPTLTNKSQKPDFLVTGHGISFYIEAKVATNMKKKDQAKANVRNLLLDKLDEIPCPNFGFIINKLKVKRTNPNISKIVKHFKEYANANPKILESEYDDEDIYLKIMLLPMSPPKIDGERTICIESFEHEYQKLALDEVIKNSFDKKIKKYGILDKPYILCINILSGFTDDFSVYNALFGSLKVNTSDLTTLREPNGRFWDKKGSINENTSGILITNIETCNLTNPKHWLIEHPFSNNPIDFGKIELSRLAFDKAKSEMHKVKGKSINDILA